MGRPSSRKPASPPLRRCAALPLAGSVVASCLDTESVRDQLFDVGWRSGPGGLTSRQRAAIAGVTGHVAESVIEMLLEALGWSPLWHLTGPGWHGVSTVKQAEERGEIRPDISARVATLPPDLFRHELFIRRAPPTKRVINEIMDDVFLPLVRN